MSSVVLTISSPLTKAHLDQKLAHAGKDKVGAQACLQFIRDLLSGTQVGVIDVQTSEDSPASASGTFTLVSVIATDALTIGSQTFTFTSTPISQNDVEVDGAGDAADAAALVAAINAHTVTGKVVRATSAAGVVTVTALQKGRVGNKIPISDADTTITTSAAFLAGGTGGAESVATTYRLGL